MVVRDVVAPNGPLASGGLRFVSFVRRDPLADGSDMYLCHRPHTYFNMYTGRKSDDGVWASGGIWGERAVAPTPFWGGCPYGPAKVATWSLHGLASRGGVQPQQTRGTWRHA